MRNWMIEWISHLLMVEQTANRGLSGWCFMLLWRHFVTDWDTRWLHKKPLQTLLHVTCANSEKTPHLAQLLYFYFLDVPRTYIQQAYNFTGIVCSGRQWRVFFFWKFEELPSIEYHPLSSPPSRPSPFPLPLFPLLALPFLIFFPLLSFLSI